MECKYKPVERIGLYIMILILLLLGPCDMHSNHRELIDKLEHIEILLETPNQPKTLTSIGKSPTNL